MPTLSDIHAQLEKASKTEFQSRWPGMTYEQGVIRAIDWMRGDEELPPMDDEE